MGPLRRRLVPPFFCIVLLGACSPFVWMWQRAKRPPAACPAALQRQQITKKKTTKQKAATPTRCAAPGF